MPCMEYEPIANFHLAFKNRYILGNKKIRVGEKIRVGRVIGNKHIFSLGPIVWNIITAG